MEKKGGLLKIESLPGPISARTADKALRQGCRTGVFSLTGSSMSFG